MNEPQETEGAGIVWALNKINAHFDKAIEAAAKRDLAKAINTDATISEPPEETGHEHETLSRHEKMQQFD